MTDDRLTYENIFDAITDDEEEASQMKAEADLMLVEGGMPGEAHRALDNIIKRQG